MQAIATTFRTVFAWWVRVGRVLWAWCGGGVQPLDVQALSPHWQRDLNLHDTTDARLQAQKAWEQYERYRDWRRPL